MCAGDSIRSDESVATIETDKVTIEVSYTGSKSGVLSSIHIAEGDKVTVGQAVATVDDSQDTQKAAGGAESDSKKHKEEKVPTTIQGNKAGKQVDEGKVCSFLSCRYLPW
jgi:pyruvate/2-oxoglutarate dehydrogenase complex dihydrolipoamide acyltransferase (E2) component